MGRPAHLFVPVDVNYLDDDRIIQAGNAWPLHFAALLTCKRLLSDGRLTRRQLRKAGIDLVDDVDVAIKELVEVGLLEEEGDDTFVVRSWGKWNDSVADIERASQDGAYGNHKRWHEAKGHFKKGCPYCAEGRIASRSGGDSGPDRGPSRGESLVDTETDAEADAESASSLSLCSPSPSPSSSREATPKAPTRDEVAKAIAANCWPVWVISELSEQAQEQLFKLADQMVPFELDLKRMPALVAKWRESQSLRIVNPVDVCHAVVTGDDEVDETEAGDE